jgi:4'-phosphopantetheinyl transferase EntD
LRTPVAGQVLRRDLCRRIGIDIDRHDALHRAGE